LRSVAHGEDAEGYLLEVETLMNNFCLRGRPSGVVSLAYTPDGKTLATGGGYVNQGEVRLWDPATGKEGVKLKGHPNLVNGVAFAPDGKRLVSASNDKTAKVWDVTDG